MREYARAKLCEAGEETGITERCIDHYRVRSLEFEQQARYRLVDCLSWADTEIDNVRGALLDCLSGHDFASGLDIASGLRFYWVTRGTTEGVDWLDRLLASGEPAGDSEVRACYLRGWLSRSRASRWRLCLGLSEPRPRRGVPVNSQGCPRCCP